MSQYIRKKFPGGYFFFTVVTHNRRPLFNSSLARSILKSTWLDVQKKYPFQVIALCLLPEHIHCLLRLPEGDSDYSIRWSAIKAGFTKNYLAAGGREIPQSESRHRRRLRGIWQKRFWEHQIRDYDDLHNHVHYIHYNPVKHKLTEKVSDWPWSTFHQNRWRNHYKDFDWSGISAFGEGEDYLD